jgi:hypothetical protein
MPAPTEAPTVSLSCQFNGDLARATLTDPVANNFWGRDDAGYTPLLERMHNAKVSNDELKAFYTSTNLLEKRERC